MGRIRADSHATPPNAPEPRTDTGEAPGASGRAGGAAGRVLRQPAPPSPGITHEQFRALIVDYARLLGWRCYWVWSSAHSPDGYPDLTMVWPGYNGLPGRVLWAELKVGRDRLSPAQREWGRALVDAGQCWCVWRPKDWAVILEVLGGAPGGERGE